MWFSWFKCFTLHFSSKDNKHKQINTEKDKERWQTYEQASERNTIQHDGEQPQKKKMSHTKWKQRVAEPQKWLMRHKTATWAEKHTVELEVLQINTPVLDLTLWSNVWCCTFGSLSAFGSVMLITYTWVHSLYLSSATCSAGPSRLLWHMLLSSVSLFHVMSGFVYVPCFYQLLCLVSF